MSVNRATLPNPVNPMNVLTTMIMGASLGGSIGGSLCMTISILSESILGTEPTTLNQDLKAFLYCAMLGSVIFTLMEGRASFAAERTERVARQTL